MVHVSTLRLSVVLSAISGIALTALLCALAPPVSAEDRGRFVGRLITEWLDDGRNMRLIQRFGFEDAKKSVWAVPPGTVVNGASIPPVFWSFIGSPFGDKYRKASVIHDHYCETRTRASDKVHRVFYEAMLAAGVGRSKAWIMYQAVLQFGPNWKISTAGLAKCQRVNGRIDFSTCTRNAPGGKPKVVRNAINRASLAKFVEQMKRAGHADAANELARTLN
jgi:Protein of unknown function (DUF1353)